MSSPNKNEASNGLRRIIMNLVILIINKNIHIPKSIIDPCKKELKILLKEEKARHEDIISLNEDKSDRLSDIIDKMENNDIDTKTKVKEKIKIDSIITELKSMSDFEILGITEEEYNILLK